MAVTVEVNINDIVNEAIDKVDEEVRRIVKEHEHEDINFFDVYYKVHLTFIGLYISKILVIMDEFARRRG